MKTNTWIQKMPLLRLALCLVAGIFVSHVLPFQVSALALAVALLVLVIVTLFFSNRSVTQSSLLMAATVLLGVVLTNRQKERMALPVMGQEQNCEAVLMSEPVERGRVVQCDLYVMTGTYANRNVRAAILKDTVDNHWRRLHVGDGVVIRSVMEQPAAFRESNFDYPMYLKSRGVTATTFVFWNAWRKCVIDLHDMPAIERVRLTAMKWRQQLLARYRQLRMGDDEYALVSAMALGDKSGLSKELREIYSVSGSAHVIAISGLHLGIIYMFLSLMFRIRKWQVVREVLILCAVWAYVFLVGMSPSVTRSATMITIYSIVSLMNRDKMSLNTLGLAAIIMLCVNPLMLFDVGFELSFMAVFFILLLYRPVYRLVSEEFLLRHRLMRWAWSLTVVSVVAQMGTMPLVLYYFGRFSVYFLPANFIVIPIATVIIYGSVLMVLTLPVLPLQHAIATVVAFFAKLQNAGLSWISALPAASIDGIVINSFQLFLLYVFIFCLLLVFHKLRVFRLFDI